MQNYLPGREEGEGHINNFIEMVLIEINPYSRLSDSALAEIVQAKWSELISGLSGAELSQILEEPILSNQQVLLDDSLLYRCVAEIRRRLNAGNN